MTWFEPATRSCGRTRKATRLLLLPFFVNLRGLEETRSSFGPYKMRCDVAGERERARVGGYIRAMKVSYRRRILSHQVSGGHFSFLVHLRTCEQLIRISAATAVHNTFCGGKTDGAPFRGWCKGTRAGGGSCPGTEKTASFMQRTYTPAFVRKTFYCIPPRNAGSICDITAVP